MTTDQLDLEPQDPFIHTSTSAEFEAVLARQRAGELVIYSVSMDGVAGWKFKVRYPLQEVAP